MRAGKTSGKVERESYADMRKLMAESESDREDSAMAWWRDWRVMEEKGA